MNKFLTRLAFLLFFIACSGPKPKETVGTSSGGLTIGETSVQSTQDDGNGSLLVAQPATLSQTATLQSLSFYVVNAAGKLRLGVYDATGPGGGPGGKLAETAELTPSSGWNTGTVSSVSLNAGTYWLAYLASDDNLSFVKTPNSSSSRYYSYTYGSMPSMFSTSPSTTGSHWSLYATLSVASSNAAPTIATAAAASPNPVSGTSSSLSALGADDGGESALTYTWSVTGTPPASVSWSANGTPAAKSTTATFSKAGPYSLLVTVQDAGGLTVTSPVSVTVNQTLAGIAVAPTTASVLTSATRQFSATSTDQFGQSMTAPSLTWATTGGGTISSGGLFTAGTTAGGPFSVSASSGAVSGNASLTVTAPAQVAPIQIGNTAVQSPADNGNSLLYAQTAILSQSAVLQSLSFYVPSASGRLRLGVYDASGPSGGPGQKLSETAELTPVAGWNTANVSSLTLNPGTYWLAYLPSSDGLTCGSGLAFVKSVGSTSKYYSYSYGSLPSTFSTVPSSSGLQWSLYATLAPQGLPGPLTVSSNPNYFQDATGRAIALFGSHAWNNLQDWGTNGTPQALDFNAYTNFLTAHGHNFTLLWRTELPKTCGLPTLASNSPDITVTSQPWPRTGPGVASDGGPKFDLSMFDQAYFDRLRSRVQQLNTAGIWTGVYLFTGEWLESFRCSTDGYPFTGSNNVNSIDDGGGMGSVSMTSPNAITAIQDAMVDKMIDTLNDLPNVLWIVSEESPANSLWWNQHMIAHVKTYESAKPYQHPVGYGSLADGSLDSNIINSDADWVAPFSKISTSTTCGSGHPACKVNINDSDHSTFGMWNFSALDNRQYAWENFARGSQVAFMDPYTLYYSREGRNFCISPTNGICTAPDARWDNFRDTMGAEAAYSRRMNLKAAHDLGSVCSTGYCLGETPAVGTEILTYAPTGGAITLNLSSSANRALTYEWFDPRTLAVVASGSISGGSASQVFSVPGSIVEDAVLYVVDAAGHG